jgi:branched-chain amino acid transport system substrate-binding protein
MRGQKTKVALAIWMWAVLLVLAPLVACTDEQGAEEGSAIPESCTEGDIIIGVAWPFSVTQPQIWEGLTMARDEINATGGVLGNNICLWKQDDESSARRGRLIAQQFADHKGQVAAVIGHYNSSVSIPASAIYEFSGILMLSPGSTNPKLTRQGFELVFRNIPTDEVIGEQLIQYARQQGYTRVLILAAKDTYGRGLANILEDKADDADPKIDIVDRLSYLPGSDETDLGPIVENWKRLQFDAIFVAGTMPEAGHFVRVARREGVSAPIIGGDGLATEELWQIGGATETEGIVVSSPFHPDTARLQGSPFVDAFQTRYDHFPDAWAAQGYDALHILAYAMNQARSTKADEVAQVLRALEAWPGVTGPHTFDACGDVVGKPIVLQQVQDQAFVYLTELASDPDRASRSHCTEE